MRLAGEEQPLVASVSTGARASGQTLDAALYGPVGPDRRQVRARWMIRLRWVAIAGQLSVLAPALTTGWLEEAHLTYYLVVVGALTLFNLSLHTLHDRTPDTSVALLVGQMTIDLFALGCLLLLTGGVHNPMAPITLVHASLGPLLFRGWWSHFVGSILIGLLVLISLFAHTPPALAGPHTDPAIQGAAHIIVTVVIWCLTSWLASALRARQSVIESLRLTQARQDKLRATGLLAAGFCHELATPLNTIGLRLSRLGGRLDPEDPDIRAIRDSLDSCEHALRAMIDQRLDSEELRFERISPVRFMEEVAARWSTSNRPVVVEAEAGLGLWELPRLLLAQTIADLLDNAHHAMKTVAADGPVSVRIGVEAELLLISVIDSGPGVPAAIRPHLGQPFLTTKPGGSGLGLYNATNLCVALGGRLTVEDQALGGSCITLRLRSGGSGEEGAHDH